MVKHGKRLKMLYNKSEIDIVKEGSQLSTKSQTEFVMNRELDSAIDYITNQTPGSPVTGKASRRLI